MSWEVRDRYLWLGFGAFLFIAVKGISSTLRTTLRLSEVYDPEHAKAANDIQAEDSISLKALSTLVTSPNKDISNSATTLLLSRFTSDTTAPTSLTTSLFSLSPSTRKKALQVLSLFDQHPLDLYPLNDTFVSSLHDKTTPTIQLSCRAYLRAARKYQQGRLNSLVEIAEAVEEAMRVGSGVQRVYSVGGDEDDDAFVFAEHEEMASARFQPASHRVEELVDLLAEQAISTRPMVRFASSGEEALIASSSSIYDLPAREEGVDVEHRAAIFAGLRRNSQSHLEAETRRRRREAMVLHEGSGAIGREDIIHPRTNRHS